MKTYVNSLMKFLDSSVCNFCAVETIKKELDNAGFEEIKLADAWNLRKCGKYYF